MTRYGKAPISLRCSAGRLNPSTISPTPSDILSRLSLALWSNSVAPFLLDRGSSAECRAYRRKAKARQSQGQARRQRRRPGRSQSKEPIELYYWPTPNGWKISIMLEECGLPYVVRPVDISKGEQFTPQLPCDLAEQPHAGDRRSGGPGGRPISVFESGAILQYLGRKTGKFYPHERAGANRGRRMAVLADRRARADGGAGDAFPPLRAGTDRLCGRRAIPTKSTVSTA